MSKLCVGIIFGGVSLEHDISLQSAENILRIIDREKFEVIMVKIGKDGMWYRKNVSSKQVFFNYFMCYCVRIFSSLKYWCSNKNIFRYGLYGFCEFCNRCYYDDILSKIDVVFPIVHGRGGEDGSLQGLLRVRQIPFVGTDILGSALSMDKDVSKNLLRASGLMVAPFITLTHFTDDILLNFEYYVDVLGLPLFVKPSNQGSSIGVSKVSDSRGFYRAIKLAFSFGCKVLVESAIVGRELECAVLGNENPEVSVCGEIVLDDAFYTYQKKYMCKEDVKIIIPAKIAPDISDEIRRVVLRAFRVLQCYGMARVDVFLTLDNCVIINEVNTLPGFTISSLYLKLWEETGLSNKDLVTMLIKLALEKYDEDKKFFSL